MAWILPWGLGGSGSEWYRSMDRWSRGRDIASPRRHTSSQSKVDPRRTPPTHPHPSPLPIPSPHPHHPRRGYSLAILGGGKGLAQAWVGPGGPVKAIPPEAEKWSNSKPPPHFWSSTTYTGRAVRKQILGIFICNCIPPYIFVNT